MTKGDKVYYARIIPRVGIYDLYDLTVRTVEEDWFVGIDKRDKHAYLFSTKSIGKTIFLDRNEALNIVKEAEKHKIKIDEETDYEEY